jgi:hypothetical protein
MRVAVRDILTAGGGSNTNINSDLFWVDSEVTLALNRAQDEIYKVIRRARADYFTRVVRSTDAPFRVLSQLFDPATLRWAAGTSLYRMPPDFVRMRMISDLADYGVRLSATDLSKAEFRILMNSQSTGVGQYFYDVISGRDILIRPIPQEVRDFEYIYEKSLPSMRDFGKGTCTAIEGNTTVTFSTDIHQYAAVGDEIIVDNNVPSPNLHYSVIKSIDSPRQVTVEGPIFDPNADLAGNGGATSYIISSVSEIPRHHHHLLVCLAASYCFNKGTNPHTDSAAIWRNEYDSMLPTLINDVESRQGSDVETVEEYNPYD